MESYRNRMISPDRQRWDDADFSIRPRWLHEYIGQERVKEKLAIFIEAAKNREEALDHVLLSGPPGLGKTTLASIISNEMGANLKVTSGPAIEKQGDLAAILSNLQNGDVLFIDEIHRLNRSIEEVLYPAMEDYVIDIMVGKGTTAQSIRLDVAPFTLIGATTRQGMLSSPLRDRFGVLLSLQLYENEDLATIVSRSSRIYGTTIEDRAALEIGRRSRGTPRVANRLLKRVRDVAQVKGDGVITMDLAQRALAMLEIDPHGFDALDRAYIRVIDDNFDGGPVGVDTIAASMGEETMTIEDVVEPYLLQNGFVNRTPRGRILTQKAYDYFSLKRKDEDENRRF